MEIKRTSENKITVTLKRANGAVETIDVSEKFKGNTKVGFEARILPALIAANKKAGNEILGWSFEEGSVEAVLTDKDVKSMNDEQNYIDSRKKVLAALNA